MYIYSLATTGSISFSDFLVTTDLVSQVSQATQLRARLRAVLKENRAGTSAIKEHSSGGQSNDGGGNASDWLTIVKTIEEYLPHLLAVFNSVQTDDLILRYEPVFSWRTSVSGTRFRGATRIDLPGLYYELASVLLTYALTLSNFAAATVASLGSFERDRTTSADQRKLKDERLRWSADTLCRASGVLLYLSQELLPKWSDHVGRVEGLPPDLTTEATLALSKVCLAEAQALAIRKLVSPSVAKAVDTVTPGPPLEKDHPSASLLAKLHLNVVEELESAHGLLKTVSEKVRRKGSGGEVGLSANHENDLARRVSASRDRGEEEEGGAGRKKLFSKFRPKQDAQAAAPSHSGPHDAVTTATAASSSGLDRDLDVASSLLKYLTFSTAFHRAIAYKWLAIDQGEHSGVGTAIAYLTLSQSTLSAAKDLSSGLSNITVSSASSLLSFKTKKSSSVIDQELSTVDHWLVSYRKLNDTVSFQPIPSVHDVTSKVPAGRAALALKPFKLPTPVWGPGSDGYSGTGGAGLALDQLHLLDRDHPARRGLVLEPTEQGVEERGKPGVYAGQGAYY